MGKLQCTCGFEISNTSEGVAYKANFIPDNAFVDFCKRLNAAMDLLVQNCIAEERREWIHKQLGKDYPDGISSDDMLLDYFSKEIFELVKNIYQCGGCHRIWIQRGNSIWFTSFVPENFEKSRNILGFESFEHWRQN